MKSLLAKLAVCVAIVAGGLLLLNVMVGVYRGTRDPTEWLTDPAYEFLVGDEPKELKGLARRITQFTRLDDAVQLATRKGYQCVQTRDELDRLNSYRGLYKLVCPAGREDLKEKELALVLISLYPGRFMRGVEVWRIGRLPPAPFNLEDVFAASQKLAEARGIEFATAAAFGDVLADRFAGFYAENCVGEANATLLSTCVDWRERRAKQGPPKWNGEPVKGGTHERAVSVLKDLGMQCGPLRFTDKGFAQLRCETRSFAGQLQSVSLEINTATTAPIALQAEIGDERQRIALAGQAKSDEALTASVLVQTVNGKPRTITLSLRLQEGNDDFGLKDYATLDAPSQRLVFDAVMPLMQFLLGASKEPPAVPLLQRLDTAAYMLALLGANAVELAHRELAQPPIDTVAAVALASCRVHAETDVCLQASAAAYPALRGRLTAALEEAQQATPPLPEDHPVQMRLARLARQISVLEK
jgi:hypothetical protein